MVGSGGYARDWDGVRASSHSLFPTVTDRADDLFAFQTEVGAFDVEGGAGPLLGWSEKHSGAAESFPRPGFDSRIGGSGKESCNHNSSPRDLDDLSIALGLPKDLKASRPKLGY